MIIDQLMDKKDFTNSEKQIANFILKNVANIGSLTATEVGRQSFTSKATVVRLSKKLGLTGYEELKKRVELEQAEKNRLMQLLEDEPISGDTTFREIVSIVPSIYDTAISNTKLMLDEAAMNRIVGRIQEETIVDIYGAGITYTCATTAKFKFLTIGVECSTHTSINEHYIMATRNRKNVAIILSFTGSNKAMLQTARYLKNLGTFVVGIGSAESEELKNLCDEYIGIYSKELIMSMEVMTPFISITYIFDVLFALLLAANFDSNLNNSLDVIKYGNIMKKIQST